MSVVPEIERQLRDAAERVGHSPMRRAVTRVRRWRGQLLARPLLVGVLLISSATGVALAARALVGVGSPAPREYPSLGERILPTGTRLLSLRVPDPAGGPPWGMRLIFTTADRRANATRGGAAHWGCVQIGRIVDGQLGVLGQDGAFHDDGLFHALPIQPEACGSLSRSGKLLGLTGGSNIETASAYQGLDGCVTEATRRAQAIALPSIERQLAVAKAEGDAQGIRGALEGLASYRRIAPRVNAEPTCPAADERHIDFGIAGPDARSVTVTEPGVKETIAVSPGNDGAYLVVRRRSQLQSVLPALRAGHSRQRATAPTPAPETRLSRQAERDPSTPNPVTVSPKSGGPHTAFTLSFHSLLNGGGYSYNILSNGPERCQRAAELATGGDGVAIGGVPPVRGQAITKTLVPTARGLCPGRYRIYVAYSDPERAALESFPFATVRFTVTG
jgi:hypothetical protein